MKNKNTKYTPEQIVNAEEYMTQKILINEILCDDNHNSAYMTFTIGSQDLSTTITLEDVDAIIDEEDDFMNTIVIDAVVFDSIEATTAGYMTFSVGGQDLCTTFDGYDVDLLMNDAKDFDWLA
jgi:hypothetical protein